MGRKPRRSVVETCVRGELRLQLDAKARMVLAEFFYDGKRRGPTLKLDPDSEGGEYRRKGDSHMDAFGGGWARFYTAWSDGPASEGQTSYDSWVTACVDQLRHIGVEILWHEAERAMQKRQWKAASAHYALVEQNWQGYGGGWAFDADQVRERGLTTLRLLRAVAEARLDRAQLDRVRRAMPACAEQPDSDACRRALEHAERLLAAHRKRPTQP